MTEQCEPPPEWRDRFGLHWVVRHDEKRGDLTPIICNWQICDGVGGWEYGDIHEDLGWRYLAPVTPPAAVAALVEALDGLVMACELPGDHCEVEQALPAARHALALFRGEAGR